MIEQVAKHIRTSVTTATVQQLEYKNFPTDSKVNITYYDGEESIGTFPAEEEHHLTNLKSSTNEVRVQVVDDLGNIAEGTFDIDQNIPTISYERMSRTPKSLVVKNVKLLNFPTDEEVSLVYSCAGHDEVTYTWKEDASTSLDYTLPGYDQSWEGGTLSVKASCCKGVYRADCHIDVEGQGKIIIMYYDRSRNQC